MWLPWCGMVPGIPNSHLICQEESFFQEIDEYPLRFEDFWVLWWIVFYNLHSLAVQGQLRF